MFFGGYMLMKYENLNEISYIIFCTFVLAEISGSAICVFLLDEKQQQSDLERQIPIN